MIKTTPGFFFSPTNVEKETYLRSQLDGLSVEELCSVQLFNFAQSRGGVKDGLEVCGRQMGRSDERFGRFTRTRRFQEELACSCSHEALRLNMANFPRDNTWATCTTCHEHARKQCFQKRSIKSPPHGSLNPHWTTIDFPPVP